MTQTDILCGDIIRAARLRDELRLKSLLAIAPSYAINLAKQSLTPQEKYEIDRILQYDEQKRKLAIAYKALPDDLRPRQLDWINSSFQIESIVQTFNLPKTDYRHADLIAYEEKWRQIISNRSQVEQIEMLLTEALTAAVERSGNVVICKQGTLNIDRIPTILKYVKLMEAFALPCAKAYSIEVQRQWIKAHILTPAELRYIRQETLSPKKVDSSPNQRIGPIQRRLHRCMAEIATQFGLSR